MRKALAVWTVAAALCAVSVVALAGRDQEVGLRGRDQSASAIDKRAMSVSGTIDWVAAAGVLPTFEWSLDQAVAATVTPESGGFDMTKSGTPVRVTDGTYPNGLSATQGYGHKLSSGNNWYASDANSGAVMDPAGDFSICAVVTPRGFTATGIIAGKFLTTGDQRGWALYMNAASGNVYLGISSAGTSATTVNTIKTGTPCPIGSQCFICATYDYITSGTSVGTVYVDGLSAATSSTVTGPPFNSSAQFGVGSSDDSPTANPFAGAISHMAYFKGTVLSSAQIQASREQWRGTNNTASVILATTSASPYQNKVATMASGTEPFVVIAPVNRVLIGPYGAYFGGPYTNRVTRGGFEACSGGNPNGWTVIETAGDGTAATDCDTTTFAGGATSVKVVLTGTTSIGGVKSACRTNNIGADMHAEVFAKKASGTSISKLYIEQFTAAADCTGAQTDTDITAAADLTTSWAMVGGPYAAASWDGGTQSWRLVLQETCDGGCTIYIDSANALSSRLSPINASCVCNTDLDCACSGAISSPASHRLTAGNWTVTADVRSPVDGAVATPSRYVFALPGTAGNNNRIDFYWASDVLTLDCYDSSGTQITATVAAAGNADTSYAVKAWHSADGTIRACFGGTCGTAVAGCTQASVSATQYIGSNGTTAGDIWISNLKTYNKVIRP